MATRHFLLPLLPFALVAAAPAGAPLAVTLTGFRVFEGQTTVMVCKAAEWLKPACAYSKTVPVTAATMTVKIADVAPGSYGITAYHDKNMNGKADRNLFGLPTELVGFSNDAPVRMAPPKFADARIVHGAAAQAIAVKMRKLP